jgi:small subunit ribosomal protein S16
VLVIRLSRTGRKNQPSYRIVLAEKSSPVNGKFQEILGFYNVSEGDKLNFKADRIEYWIGNGAQPSDTVAALLKNAGMPNMEKYLSPRDKKRSKKNPEEEPEVAPVAEAVAETPAEEPAKEEKAEEKPVVEVPKEEAAEEAPAEESAKEETSEEA